MSTKRNRGGDPKVPAPIREALRRFPSVVRRKRIRYQKRQKFLRETFGELVRELKQAERRSS